MCGNGETVCTCNKIMTMATMVVTTGPTVKKPSSKPWLSNVKTNLIKSSDLTTADILERQKFKAGGAVSGADEITVESAMVVNKNGGGGGGGSSTGNESPQFSELSRRDEGDGRSVADSNCSGSFKVDAQQQQQSSNNKKGSVTSSSSMTNNAINVQK